MKTIKMIVLVITAYVGIVAAIGAFVAYFQPTMPGVLTLTTTDAEGKEYERLLGRMEVGGVLYLVSNSWLRRWYHRAIAHPNVAVTLDGQRLDFTVVQLDATEHQELLEKYPMPMWMKILAGFPPRRFLRLDPIPMPNNRGQIEDAVYRTFQEQAVEAVKTTRETAQSEPGRIRNKRRRLLGFIYASSAKLRC